MSSNRAWLEPVECKGGAGVMVSGSQVSTRPVSNEVTAKEVWLNCIHCGRRVAKTTDRIEVGGLHEHTFINPVGVIYKIGCFQAAPGVTEVGPASGEFTWFAGHVWRCLSCADCRSHLGWSFTSPNSRFFGLIPSELTEGVQGDGS